MAHRRHSPPPTKFLPSPIPASSGLPNLKSSSLQLKQYCSGAPRVIQRMVANPVAMTQGAAATFVREPIKGQKYEIFEVFNSNGRIHGIFRRGVFLGGTVIANFGGDLNFIDYRIITYQKKKFLHTSTQSVIFIDNMKSMPDGAGLGAMMYFVLAKAAKNLGTDEFGANLYSVSGSGIMNAMLGPSTNTLAIDIPGVGPTDVFIRKASSIDVSRRAERSFSAKGWFEGTISF